MTKITDKQLAELFTGSRRELERFLCRRLPDEDISRDISQEAFLRLLRLENIDHIQCLEAYLFRVAANLVSEYWSSGKIRTGMTNEPIDFDHLPAEQSTQDELVEQKQSMEVLKKALNLLPDLQKQVILLHRRDGMTYDEIGEQLGLSRDMVKKHLVKGLARCREYLILSQVR